MARFDVYPNPEGAGYRRDVPADGAPAPAAILNPVFLVGGDSVVMVTQFMAAVPARLLKLPLLNLESARGEIVAALDLLFQGF